MRRTLGWIAGAALALSSGSAHADDKATCDAAYDQAQTLRDARKLVEARDQLRLCARATCAASIVRDCTSWLTETEARLPTVVTIATDGSGTALVGVSVSIDHGPPRSVDGTSWEINPGPHTFSFQGSDGAKAERTVPIFEGQKDQRVAITLGGSLPGISLPVVAPIVVTPLPPPAAAEHSSSPLKPIGYTMAAVGVAGIAVGAVFGALALSTKSAHCTADACTGDYANQATNDGHVSTIGFIAGGVLAAGGVVLVLAAPKSGKEHALRIDARPLVGQESAGVALGGSFW